MKHTNHEHIHAMATPERTYPETEVQIPINEKLTLAGSLVDPSATTATTPPVMVLFLAGSGPIDRDENVGWMQRLNVFNTLSQRLAADGIASFRYDKRGTGKSLGVKLDAAGLYDLLNDIVAVVDYFGQESYADGRYANSKLILVGHSEGTILAAMTSLKRPDRVDSLVLVCPFCTPLDEVLVQQAKAVEKKIEEAPGCGGMLQRTIVNCFGLHPVKVQAGLIQKIKASSDVTIRFMLQPIPALWFREHFALDAADVYRKVSVPTSVVVGSFDTQCDPQDGPKIVDLVPSNNAKLRVVDRLTHLLRKEETNTGFTGYGKQMKEPLDEELQAVVSRWCTDRAASNGA